MKKYLFFLFLLFFVLAANAQISTCSWHDGYWGEWKSHTIWRYSNGYPNWNEYKLYGNYSGFCIYKDNSHPSEFIFKFQANSYIAPDKSTIKNHLKNNLWYEYSGIVEYYVTEDYPTIESVLKAFDFPYFNCNSGYNGNPCVKRTAKATIKIAPYRKRPQVYNIYFDNVAVGIYMEDSYFNQ